MAVRVTHAKVSGKTYTGSDPDRVGGQHWDADHTIADLTIPGSVAFVGAYAATFTLNGTTGLTFPTTGTLATTADLASGYQPLDSDLTAIAAISPSNDDFIQRKAGAWTNRTVAQVLTDLAAAGTTFQPLDSDLTAVAALSPSNDDIIQRKAGAWTNRTIAQLLTDLAAPGTTFQPLDSDLTSIAALTTATFGRSLLTETSAANAFTTLKQAATDTATGVVELATTTEAQTGTDTSRAVTPAGLRAATREKLTANRTYYVRTDGSNSNDGLADTSGGAFLTVQKAIDVTYTLDLGGFTVTIQVGNGTYTTNLTADKPFVGGNVQLQGDTTTPSNVVISTTGTGLTASNKAVIYIKGFKFVNASSGYSILAQTNATININGLMEYGASVNASLGCLDANITVTGNFTVSGNSFSFALILGGTVVITNMACTLSGTPAFSGAFIYAYVGGKLVGSGFTYSGSATGVRANAMSNAVIYTAGGGASYFPGDSANTTSTGGQIV